MGGPKRPSGDALRARIQAWGDEWRAIATATDPAGNTSYTAAISVVVDNTAPTAGTLSFVDLVDSGRTSDATVVTTDKAFDLSLTGNDDANGTSVVYEVSLNGGAWTTTTASQMARMRCRCRMFSSPVTNCDSPECVAMNPSRLCPRCPTVTGDAAVALVTGR